MVDFAKLKQFMEIPETAEKKISWLDVDPLQIEQWKAQHIIYWNAPQAVMSNNTAIWENLIFENECGYYEWRNYAEDSNVTPFVNNFSDFNIWYSAKPEGYCQHELGNYKDFEEWRRGSGRDANSVILNPRTEPEKLPAWAKTGEEYWQEKCRSPQEMKALNLNLKNRTIDLAITWVPVYLRGVGAEIKEIKSSILNVKPFNLPGENIPVEVLFRNEEKIPSPPTLRSLANNCPVSKPPLLYLKTNTMKYTIINKAGYQASPIRN